MSFSLGKTAIKFKQIKKIRELFFRGVITCLLISSTSIMLGCGKPDEVAPASMVSEIASKSKELEMQKERIAEDKKRIEEQKELREKEVSQLRNEEEKANFWRIFAILGIVGAFVGGVALGSKTKKAANYDQPQSVEPRK